MTRRSRETAALLWTCLLLFAARVVAQFEAFTSATTWRSGADAWHPGMLPYPLLLPTQIALLMIMAVVAWNRRVRTGRVAAAHPRTASALRILAGLYFVATAVWLAVALNEHGVESWRDAAVPVTTQWILALFLLVSMRAAPAVDSKPPRAFASEESDEPHGDVPALAPVAPHPVSLREYRAGQPNQAAGARAPR